VGLRLTIVVEPLEAKTLEYEAVARTGLTDFGTGDWREALAVLLDSAEQEAQLSATGRLLLHWQVLDRLVNRLEIQEWVARHPEVRDQRVEAPLILATLPRTGQTAAGWILDRDPANRSLQTWFAKRPCPPPRPGRNRGDPRVERAHAAVAALPRELRALHLTAADEPDECHWLLSNGLKTPHEIYSMRVPGYYRWLRDDAGMRSTYAYYHLQLQLLQSRTPNRRWVLRNSPHLLYLEHLHAVLPDAIFVQFHRDPLEVLASNCRLAVVLRNMASYWVDPHEVGSSMLLLLRDYLERLLRFRASGRSRPWIDVRFADFVADPVGVIEGLYDSAGIPLAAEARQAMAAWVREHPRQDLPRSRASELAAYGIDPADARAAFAEYCETFDVRLDGV
jgi:hypothetical protein